VADVAVFIAKRANCSVVQFIFVAKIGVPLIVVRLPGNVVFQQDVGDAALAGRRNRKRRVVDEVVVVSVGAVAKIARIVIVQQVVVARFAVGIDRTRERSQVLKDRAHAGLRG